MSCKVSKGCGCLAASSSCARVSKVWDGRRGESWQRATLGLRPSAKSSSCSLQGRCEWGETSEGGGFKRGFELWTVFNPARQKKSTRVPLWWRSFELSEGGKNLHVSAKITLLNNKVSGTGMWLTAGNNSDWGIGFGLKKTAQELVCSSANKGADYVQPRLGSSILIIPHFSTRSLKNNAPRECGRDSLHSKLWFVCLACSAVRTLAKERSNIQSCRCLIGAETLKFLAAAQD